MSINSGVATTLSSRRVTDFARIGALCRQSRRCCQNCVVPSLSFPLQTCRVAVFSLPTSWGGGGCSDSNTGMSRLHSAPNSEGERRYPDLYAKKNAGLLQGVVGTVETRHFHKQKQTSQVARPSWRVQKRTRDPRLARE